MKGLVDKIITRKHWNVLRCQRVLQNETFSVLGYGPQGRGQALNLRDRGFDVVLGLREGTSWTLARQDGWIPGKNLLSVDEAASRGSIIQYLVSDAAQITLWPDVKRHLTRNKSLYFSHGFGIVFQDKTSIVPPENIDVFMVAPKGPGGLVRSKFLQGSGINSSYAIHQDYTGSAKSKCLATAFAIGSLNCFPTTFEKEVYSDLTGERSVLMGMIQGAFLAQYEVLRENGHDPLEAFNETVEEALFSLYPLIHEKGMDWMFRNCSTTAQRGALDWAPEFKRAIKPVIEECYQRVKSGVEADRAIQANSDPEYRKGLEQELQAIDNQEIWQVGKLIRQHRM